MDMLHAIIYGIIEGITEFLPISSTGHLMLVTELLGESQSGFIKSFEIMIQLGAILAIVVLYPRRLLQERATQLRIVVAFLPTAIIGLLCYKIVKTYLLGNVPVVLFALFGGGVIIIAIERLLRSSPRPATITLPKLSLPRSALLGLLQCIAFIPGVSRSATTIFGGMFLGLSRKDAVEFSFLLAVPTMGAATALDILKHYREFTPSDLGMLAVGFTVAFFVALVVVRWLARFVATNDFTWFGVYRILIALFGYLLFFN